MANQVQANIQAIAHAVEHGLQRVDRRRRNLCNTRFEKDRRHDARELDRLEMLDFGLTQLDLIAGIFIDARRILHPLHQRRVRRQVSLDGLENLAALGAVGVRSHRHDGRDDQHQFAEGLRHHHSFLTLGVSGGPPSRQKISGSIASL